MGDTGKLQKSSLPRVLHGALINHQLDDLASISEIRNAQDTLPHPLLLPAPLATHSDYRQRSFSLYSSPGAGPSRQFNSSYYQSSSATQPPVRLPSFSQGFGSMIDNNPIDHTVDSSASHNSYFRQQLPMDRREEAGPSSFGRSHSSPGWHTGRRDIGYPGEPIQYQHQVPPVQRVSSPTGFRPNKMHASPMGHPSRRDSDSQRTRVSRRDSEDGAYDGTLAHRSMFRDTPTEFDHNSLDTGPYGFTNRPDFMPLESWEPEAGVNQRHTGSSQGMFVVLYSKYGIFS
jgi:hypothetical protein